jgi:inorganic triphosphatase YgiF
MGKEIELKFALDPGDEGRLRAAAPLAGLKPTKHRLLALYFDTPAGELAKSGLALRLRREDRKWVQTLKAPGSASHERSEWEFSRTGPSIDLSLFSETPLAKLDDPDRLHERLAEIFRIASTRTAWTAEPESGTRVEVVLDQGEIEANGRTASICEVEVESKAGETEAIFDMGAQLVDQVELRLTPVSKAERGHRLRTRAKLQPAKSAEIRLDKDMRVGAAARAVVGADLAHFHANEEGVLASSDPEFVHQARVALRRMRSALQIFRDVIGPERAKAWRAALGETARVLGVARDWDVFGTEALPPMLAAFGDAALKKALGARVLRRRRAERAKARAALVSKAHAHTVLEISRWIAHDEPAAGAAPIADFASKIVRKRHKRLVADAAHFATLDAEERHRLRIDVKRVRYGIDALASLFPEKRVARYLENLEALQDGLGHANDAVTAQRLLPELEPPAELATFARGWLSAQAAGDSAVLEALVERLAKTRRFWKGKGGNVVAPTGREG